TSSTPSRRAGGSCPGPPRTRWSRRARSGSASWRPGACASTGRRDGSTSRARAPTPATASCTPAAIRRVGRWSARCWRRPGAGERFTDELAARDQVARAIAREIAAGRGPVTLDLRHLDAERVHTRFPRIHATCLRYGIDIAKDLVPVSPAAHYVMGGVATDLQ